MGTIEKVGGRQAGSGREKEVVPLIARSLLQSLTESLEQAIEDPKT